MVKQLNACRLCGADAMQLVIELGSHPIAHRFLINQTDEEATFPFDLTTCPQCHFLQIDTPIAPATLYDNYFCLSEWKYQPHILYQIKQLQTLSESNQDPFVLEIGSNDGRFLQALQQAGFANVLGVEPTQDAAMASKAKQLPTLNAFFGSHLAHDILATYGQCDVFIARQMLEHIEDLQDYGAALKQVLKPGALVLIEVPNFAYNLETPDYSGLWEEHCNYFTQATLKTYLGQLGIDVIQTESTNFCGEALTVYGRYTGSSGSPAPVADDGAMIAAFAKKWPTFCQSWREYLQAGVTDGKRFALYGAGCRVNSLLNFTGCAKWFDCIVDDQAEKQGLYMPGSRLPIKNSQALYDEHIDICFLGVNAENDAKVIAKHEAFVKAGGQFIPLLGPSESLLPFWRY